MMASPHLVIGYGPLNGLSSLIEYFPDASIRHLMETYRSSYIVEKDSSSMGKKSSIFSTRGSTEEGPAVPLQSGDGIQLIPGHILRPQRWENLEDQWDRKLRIQTIE